MFGIEFIRCYARAIQNSTFDIFTILGNNNENSGFDSLTHQDALLTDEEQKSEQAKEEDNIDFGSSGTVEDTAIKIIRVFANVSINSEAGTSLALCENVVDALLEICKLPLQNSVLASDRSKYDNILLPTLATLNNLSFYPLVHQKETYKILKYFLHPTNHSMGATNEFSSAGIAYQKDHKIIRHFSKHMDTILVF